MTIPIQPTLRTPRLLLRKFKLEDASDVQQLAGDWDVAKTTLNIPHPYSLSQAEEWIESHASTWRDREGIVFAITSIEQEHLVGAISFRLYNKVATLGYWIGKPYWGQGYCTEATKALVGFGFDALGLTKVVAEHLASNPASGRVMQKSGMSYVKEVQKPDRTGETTRLEVYEITP